MLLLCLLLLVVLLLVLLVLLLLKLLLLLLQSLMGSHQQHVHLHHGQQLGLLPRLPCCALGVCLVFWAP